MKTAETFAFAAGVARQSDPALAVVYTDQAIDYLQRSIQHGQPKEIWVFLNNPFFEPIVDDPHLIPLQIDAELDNIPAIKLARQGDATRARAELVTLLQKGDDSSAYLRAEFLVDVILGDELQARRRLETAIADLPEHHEWRYWGAIAAYAVGSDILSEKTPDLAREFADRAFEMLEARTKMPIGRFVSAFRRDLLMH